MMPGGRSISKRIIPSSCCHATLMRPWGSRTEPRTQGSFSGIWGLISKLPSGVGRMPRKAVKSWRTQAPNMGWSWEPTPVQVSQRVVAPRRFWYRKEPGASLSRSFRAVSMKPCSHRTSIRMSVPKKPVSKWPRASYCAASTAASSCFASPAQRAKASAPWMPPAKRPVGES